jgi:hypothetical protein
VIADASRDELKEFLHRRHPPRVEEFMASLGLSIDAVDGLVELRNKRMDHAEIRNTVLAIIADTPGVKAKIIAISAERRRLLVDHLLRSVRPGGREIFVDLGWGATIQSHMQRALEMEGVQIEGIGLYLVTTGSAVERIVRGVHAEGFLASAGQPDVVGRWITRSPEALEQICMSDEGSLVGISDTGETVHAQAESDGPQRLQRHAVQDGARSFQQIWRRYQPFLPEHLRALHAAPRDYLRAIVLRFVIEPMQSEAWMFSGWLHDENFGSDRSEGMVAGELAAMAAHMTPTQFLDLPMARVYWPFALAAMHNPPLSLAAASVAADIAPAGAFASEVAMPWRVEVDGGAGFIAAAKIKVHSNVNGLSFARAEFLQTTRVMRIFFGDAPGVVRLDALRAVFHLTDGTTLEEHLSTPDDFVRLEAVRGLRLAANVVFGVNSSPVVSLAVPNDRPPAFRVEIEVAFASLGTPPVRARRELAAEVAAKAVRSLKRRARRTFRPNLPGAAN